jgi:hypothetical protein
VTASLPTMAARSVTAGQDAGASAVDTISSAFGDGVVPDVDELRGPLVRGSLPGRAGEPAEVVLRLVQDHDRIAEGLNDVVVRRLFTAALALETALGLMGDHPGVGKVREAIGELDLAIRDFRNVVFGHHRPG